MMKRILSIFICFFMFNVIQISAVAESKYGYVYGLNGKITNNILIRAYNLIWKDSNVYSLEMENDINEPIIVEPIIKNSAFEYEHIIILDLKTDDIENPYPEIESMDVKVACDSVGGGQLFLGKDYRLIRITEDGTEELNSNIISSSDYQMRFTVNQLGKYVVYLNPNVYDLTFYYDERSGDINPEIYYEILDKGRNDVVVFPPIPQKDGYVFTGWKVSAGSGEAYVHKKPVKMISHSEMFATWCKEEDYEPINLALSANTPITKGKENGKKLTLTTNYGIFLEDSTWPENWKIVGNDELAVEHVEIVDDKTVEITLLGNSRDICSKSEISVAFLSGYLFPEPYEQDGEIIDWVHTKIKMDEDGVMAEWYRSDNTITLERQKRVNSGSGGGGGSTANYTVTFADGESKETVKVKQNAKVSEPEVPEKEGYVFGGWYLDEKCTVAYDFSAKVTRNFTLYAKWNEAEKTENTQITLTVGEKEAVVNGETKENDVAPMIKDDRAFLPARFVAESLGADVLWDAEAKTVTIQKENTKIVLTIGEKDAEINGETVISDVAPFIENDRTYTPIRLIAEALGADVEWNGEMNKIIITK